MGEINIEANKTALIVVDMQKGFIEKGAFLELEAARNMIPTLQKLISVCRENAIPIVYTRMSHQFIKSTVYPELWPDHFNKDGSAILVPGSREFELVDELELTDEDLIVDKDRYSAFFGTKLDIILKEKGIQNVIITGLASNVCCESTARDAFFLNYRVIFLDDCNATLNDEMHRGAVENIKLVFGYVLNSQELIEKI